MWGKVKKLEELRNKIDVIDSEIIALLNDRLALVLQIKKAKKNLNIPVEDLNRELEVLQNLQSGNLEQKFIKDLYDVIFAYSKEIQNKQ